MLHPVRVLDRVIQEYRDYLLTEFRAKDPALKDALERELDRPRFLAQEPFFQAHRPFRAGRRWRELSIDARLAGVMEQRAGRNDPWADPIGARFPAGTPTRPGGPPWNRATAPRI